MGPHCLHSWGSQPLTWGHICLPHILSSMQNTSHMSPHHSYLYQVSLCPNLHVLVATQAHVLWSSSSHTFPHSHIQQSLSTYCVPRAVPGDGDTAMTNIDKISAPAELTSWLGKWTVGTSGRHVLRRKLKQERGWESWARETF